MRTRSICLAFALGLGAIAAGPLHAQGAQPYRVEIWADALFDADGKLERLDVPDAGQQPAAFVERVRRQLASARVPPVKDDAGAPASFQTGIWLHYQVTPGDQGGKVQLQGMKIGPRPLKVYAAAQPDQLPADTPLTVKVRCEVGIDGRCGAVKVVEATGTSDALRRWAVASFKGWEFAPQRVGGRPVVSEAAAELVLSVADDRPADFRDPRRL